MVSVRRTEIQRDANDIDCELYRVITRVERLYDGIKRRNPVSSREVLKALMSLRSARKPIRDLMHKHDVEMTI